MANGPFVGALTMELPTDADEEVASWIAAGTPPIFFGFGSVTVASAADTIAIISAACAQLGEQALVCACWSDFSHVPYFEHVKVVGTVYSAAMSKSRRTGAKRAAGSSSFRPAAAQVDQLHAATRAKSSRFNAAAVSHNLETLFEQMYRRYRAGPPAAHLMVEHRAPAPHAASSAELCS